MSRELLSLAMNDRRHELGLSLIEAARRAGVARSTWSDLEAAKRQRVTATVARRVDDVLGWAPTTTYRAFNSDDPNYLFQFSGTGTELGDQYRLVDADGRTRLERIARRLSDEDAALLAEIGERMVALEELRGRHAQLVDAIARAQERLRDVPA